MGKKADANQKRPTRDDSVTFLCSDAEKDAYDRAWVATDHSSMSHWIRRTLKAELDKLGIVIKQE